MKTSVNKKRHAFTIVELLIVIVVIAILATLSIVAFNGVQRKARESAATQSLAQAKTKLEMFKVDNHSYPLTGNLSSLGVEDGDTAFQYTSLDGTSYCLTAVNGDVSYKASSTGITQLGGCADHTWPGGVQVTNLVSNGNFSQGTTGWLESNAGSVAVVDGAAVFTPIGNPASSTSTHHLYQTVSLVTNNVYYLRADVSGNAKLALTSYSYPANTGSSWGSYSVRQVATVTAPRAVGVRSTQTSAWGQVAFKNFVFIDLTSAFGAGNEPTKEQMDEALQQFPGSWFEGTVTVGLGSES